MIHALQGSKGAHNWFLMDIFYLEADGIYSMEYQVIVLYEYGEGGHFWDSFDYDNII